MEVIIEVGNAQTGKLPSFKTMSRSPFPTSSVRRPRSPVEYNNYSEEPTMYQSSTRPLQISRYSRSETPGSSYVQGTSPGGPTIASPNGPSRPQRSELRSRQFSEYSNSDQASGSRQTWDREPVGDRESVSTTRSDASTSQGNSYRPRTGSTASVRTNSKSRGNTQDSEKSTVSPTSMAAILAFQNAGQRKRAQTNGSEENEHEKERRKAREKEKLTQQRIKEKAPGRRTNGKARAGDIDGNALKFRPGDVPYKPVQLSWMKSRTNGIL